MNVEVRPAVEDEDLVELVSSIISEEGIITWRELKALVPMHVSFTRLKRILFTLLKENRIVELPCRVLVTPQVYKQMMNGDESRIVELIREKLAGLRKCGRPILSPVSNVRITISRKTGKASVEVFKNTLA